MKTQVRKVLILGSGAIRIGQAGEFDYSGSQAIKALKQEGIQTVLINPNIATIQTSEGLADRVYFLPLTAAFARRVIEREKPDGILLGFGGQTALNVGLELAGNGDLATHHVEVLGTPVEAILKTEDRNLFTNEMERADLNVPRSRIARSLEEARKSAESIGYPVMIRAGFALGGLGSGVVENEDQLSETVSKALSYADHILVEESLLGWKEIEYEVVRDRFDNCIVVCSMENLDPMGIHTGESAVVAPVQTLNAAENFHLRSIAIRAVRHLGIVGECNIQYALDPKSGDYRIIEINPRLSRSSALASKATGYPLAFIAAKLALGQALISIKNMVTGITSACFEPALDYVVVKLPRWDLEKFHNVSRLIGSEMKSVGEVMSIGRTFEEAIQKSIRMLNNERIGLVGNRDRFDDLEQALTHPTDNRLYAVASALDRGWSVDQIHEQTRITPWFIHKLNNIVGLGKKLSEFTLESIPDALLREAKEKGFSDVQLSKSWNCTEKAVRDHRKGVGIVPAIKQIDTLAGEFPAQTNYLYMTYSGAEDDVDFQPDSAVVVLGSGPYKIGSSVEFDWCCVNAVSTLKEMEYKTIMINCNPETVSTDYDICDRLYFEELTHERVMDIHDKEKPAGVIVSMGGQIPNNLALPLKRSGVALLGTDPDDIDKAEDRHKFSALLDTLRIDQPRWEELTCLEDAEHFADTVGYPVLIRPSYVLSGAAMSTALNGDELRSYLDRASKVNRDHPVVISKFITGAREIEMDAVGEKGELYCYAVSEHVENAGVHSGDATLVLPPQRTWLETMRRVKVITREIARALRITGPFNIQFIAKDNEVKVIECNLRASRSFPFVSKIYRINFIDAATRLIMGRKMPKIHRSSFDMDYVGVKAPQFSFTRLKGSDPVLGVEMASTGEVACIGDDVYEAFLKSILSVGFHVPKKGILLSTGTLEHKVQFLDALRELQGLGCSLYATPGTAGFMGRFDIPAETVHWPSDNQEPGALACMDQDLVDLVINIPKDDTPEELENDYRIRRHAIDRNIPLITNLRVASYFIRALARYTEDDLAIKAWDEYE
jgi:carbamoyl-phosphate synthase large subunit